MTHGHDTATLPPGSPDRTTQTPTGSGILSRLGRVCPISLSVAFLLWRPPVPVSGLLVLVAYLVGAALVTDMGPNRSIFRDPRWLTLTLMLLVGSSAGLAFAEMPESVPRNIAVLVSAGLSLGTGCGLLLLFTGLAIDVVAMKCKRCAARRREGTVSVGNPSVSSGGEQP